MFTRPRLGIEAIVLLALLVSFVVRVLANQSVNLSTGDVAVGPFQIELDEGCNVSEAGSGANEGDDVLTRVDRRDENEEYGIANNGTRTVTMGEVRFHRIQGRWLVDSIESR